MTTVAELRIDDEPCTRCKGDVAFLPPCTCGHGEIGSCTTCGLVVVLTPGRFVEIEQHRDGRPPEVHEFDLVDPAPRIDLDPPAGTPEELRHLLDQLPTAGGLL